MFHVHIGIMLESEKKIVEMMDERATMSKYWMPLVWATNIINRARKEGLIRSDHLVQTLLVELSEHRRKLGSIISYDTVCLPLVYTQVDEKPMTPPLFPSEPTFDSLITSTLYDSNISMKHEKSFNHDHYLILFLHSLI